METERKISEILEKIRPYIQTHGGDVCLQEVSGETAFIKFSGSCAHCPLVNITYNKIIKPLVDEAAPEIKNVIIN